MKITLKKEDWTVFLAQHRATYIKMLRAGRSLVQQLDQTSDFYQQYLRRNPSYEQIASDLRDAEFPYKDAALQIVQSEYTNAYLEIMSALALLCKRHCNEPDSNDQYTPRADALYSLTCSIINAASALSTTPFFCPESIAIILNRRISNLLCIEGEDELYVFFPYMTLAELDAQTDARLQAPVTANLQFRCLQALVALGLVLLALAILTSTPVATALGIASGITSQTSAASAVAAGITFLLAGGIYAVRTRHSNLPPDSTPAIQLI